MMPNNASPMPNSAAPTSVGQLPPATQASGQPYLSSPAVNQPNDVASQVAFQLSPTVTQQLNYTVPVPAASILSSKEDGVIPSDQTSYQSGNVAYIDVPGLSKWALNGNKSFCSVRVRNSAGTNAAKLFQEQTYETAGIHNHIERFRMQVQGGAYIQDIQRYNILMNTKLWLEPKDSANPLKKSQQGAVYTTDGIGRFIHGGQFGFPVSTATSDNIASIPPYSLGTKEASVGAQFNFQILASNLLHGPIFFPLCFSGKCRLEITWTDGRNAINQNLANPNTQFGCILDSVTTPLIQTEMTFSGKLAGGDLVAPTFTYDQLYFYPALVEFSPAMYQSMSSIVNKSGLPLVWSDFESAQNLFDSRAGTEYIQQLWRSAANIKRVWTIMRLQAVVEGAFGHGNKFFSYCEKFRSYEYQLGPTLRFPSKTQESIYFAYTRMLQAFGAFGKRSLKLIPFSEYAMTDENDVPINMRGNLSGQLGSRDSDIGCCEIWAVNCRGTPHITTTSVSNPPATAPSDVAMMEDGILAADVSVAADGSLSNWGFANLMNDGAAANTLVGPSGVAICYLRFRAGKQFTCWFRTNQNYGTTLADGAFILGGRRTLLLANEQCLIDRELSNLEIFRSRGIVLAVGNSAASLITQDPSTATMDATGTDPSFLLGGALVGTTGGINLNLPLIIKPGRGENVTATTNRLRSGYSVYGALALMLTPELIPFLPNLAGQGLTTSALTGATVPGIGSGVAQTVLPFSSTTSTVTKPLYFGGTTAIGFKYACSFIEAPITIDVMLKANAANTATSATLNAVTKIVNHKTFVYRLGRPGHYPSTWVEGTLGAGTGGVVLPDCRPGKFMLAENLQLIETEDQSGISTAGGNPLQLLYKTTGQITRPVYMNTFMELSRLAVFGPNFSVTVKE